MFIYIRSHLYETSLSFNHTYPRIPIGYEPHAIPLSFCELSVFICVYLALSVVSAGTIWLSVPYLRLFEILIGNNSSRHARHHQNIIIKSHTTFLFSRFTFYSSNTHSWLNPILPLLHSNHPAALFGTASEPIAFAHLPRLLHSQLWPYADMRTMPIRSNQTNKHHKTKEI